MISPTVKGPAVVSVLTTDTSADAPVRPPLPVLSVLLPGFGSGCVAETVALLSKEPGELIVAVTVVVGFPPAGMLAVGQGRGAQPPPGTLGMGRFGGVSGN